MEGLDGGEASAQGGLSEDDRLPHEQTLAGVNLLLFLRSCRCFWGQMINVNHEFTWRSPFSQLSVVVGVTLLCDGNRLHTKTTVIWGANFCCVCSCP